MNLRKVIEPINFFETQIVESTTLKASSLFYPNTPGLLIVFDWSLVVLSLTCH